MKTPPSRLRFMALVVSALLMLLAAMLLAIAAGDIGVAPGTIIDVLSNRLLDTQHPVDPIDEGIVWNYRLTRALVAACCGSALAVAGLILQTLLRNALADPYLLGISAGASTGAVLVTVAGVGGGLVSMSAGAFAGAITALTLVALLAQTAGGSGLRNSGQIILAGIAGSQLFNALTALIIAKSGSAEQARGIMFWLLGSLSGVRWPDVPVTTTVAVAGLLICQLHSRSLDAMTFGAESAASLGIPVRRVQTVLLLTASLMTSVMVSVVGAIGFVGLVIPHVARMLVGSRHRRLLPACAFIGALFLILADVASRILLTGQVLPIGVVTALIGAPAFALILIRRKG